MLKSVRSCCPGHNKLEFLQFFQGSQFWIAPLAAFSSQSNDTGRSFRQTADASPDRPRRSIVRVAFPIAADCKVRISPSATRFPASGEASALRYNCDCCHDHQTRISSYRQADRIDSPQWKFSDFGTRLEDRTMGWWAHHCGKWRRFSDEE